MFFYLANLLLMLVFSFWCGSVLLSGFSAVVEGSLGAVVGRVGLLSLLYCNPPSCWNGWFHMTELFLQGCSAVVVLCIPLRGRVVIWSRIFNFFLPSVWFSALVSLYMCKLSNVFSNLPFLVTWMIFIISSIFPIACPFSRRCWANVDLLLLYLKSLMCSWNLVLKGLPVYPVYVILQSGQVNWYTPLLSYLHWVVFHGEAFTDCVVRGKRNCYVCVFK